MKRKTHIFGRQFLTIVFWLIGLIIGFVIADTIVPSTISNERLYVSGSFGGIVISSVIPLCIAFLACRLRFDVLSYLILLANGFIYAFCSFYLSGVSGLAGSFVHILFMFAPGCCAMLLVLLCLLFSSCSGKRFNQLSCAIMIAAVLLCCIDYFMILRFTT